MTGRAWISLVCLLLFVGVRAHAATSLSAQDYDFYSANYVVRTPWISSMLFVAKDSANPSGIAMPDTYHSGGLGYYVNQSWSSNFLGLSWSTEVYNFLLADFNADGIGDIFMQSKQPGLSHLLIADSQGRFRGITQSIADGALGLGWSGRDHKLIAGDFNGDGRADLFFQATTNAGLNAIVLSAASGPTFSASSNACFSGGPHLCWSDSAANPYLGLKWSTQSAVVVAGDFNGDQKSDLFVLARPKTVMIDFDVAVPVHTYPEKMNGVVVSQSSGYTAQFEVRQLISRKELGVDLSPEHSNIVVGNFSGDGFMDIIVQARRTGQTSYQLNSNSVGQFSSAVALGGGVNWSADATRLIGIQVDGLGGVMLQANSPSGGLQAALFSSGTPQFYSQYNFVDYVPPSTVGRVPGAAGVSNTGEAQYSVPLELPEGINGLTPKLAVTYRHDASPGILGPHWGLSGLSSIKRCPATVAQDGFTSSVSMQKADKYCLDGNKLKLAAGTYGESNSSYRTELETYALITAYSSTATGPGYFKVQARDGLTYEYGNTADSAVKATINGVQVTHTWALSAIRDRDGNYISFEYVGAQSGHAHPKTILYGGNSLRNIAPQYGVYFTQNSIPPGQNPYNVSWMFGAEQTSNFYVGSIGVYHGTTHSVGYRFGYSSHGNGSPGRQLLTSIQRCGDALLSECMPATKLEWSVGREGWDAQTATIAADGWQGGGFAGDINGDGYEDLYYLQILYDEWFGNSYYWRVLWGSANGPTHSTLTIDQQLIDAFPIDLDSDGRLDLLMQVYDSNAQGRWWWLRYQDNGTFAFTDTGVPVVPAPAPSSALHTSATMDVDGDGYSDLVSMASNRTQLVIRYHNRDGSAGFESTTTTVNMGVSMDRFMWAETTNPRPMDVDGDGRQDLLVKTTGVNFSARLMYSNGSSFVAGETFNTVVQPTYANSDRCTDLLGNTSLWISKCHRASNAALNPAISVAGTTYTPSMLDYDGDGYEDRVFPENGVWHVSRSSGTGYYFPVSTGLPASGGNHRVYDVDGNGRPELIELSGQSLLVHRNTQLRQELVTDITDGLGNRASFDYALDAVGSCYTGESPAATAGVHLRPRHGKRYVVCGLISTDGVGGEYTISYDYHNARVNPQGRGFAGFARRQVTDSRTGIVITQDLLQRFPYTGMLDQERVRQADTTLISHTWTTTGLKTTSFGTSYPYIHKSETNTYEVSSGARNGASINYNTTTTELDDFGSPTSVTAETQDKDSFSTTYNQIFRRQVVSQIQENASYWCLGRPHEVTITETLAGASRTHKQTATVDYPNCRVTRETTEPDTPALKVITDYEYAPEGCGNVTLIGKTGHTSTGTGLVRRSTVYGYGEKCLAPETITDALGNATQIKYRYELGLPWYLIDPNGSDYNGPKLEWLYDNFGRPTSELRPDGTKTTWAYAGCSATNNYCGVTHARVRVDSTELGTTGSAIRSSTAYLDSMERYRLGASPLAMGTSSNVSVTYDALGRLQSRSEPYTSAATGRTEYGYDILGRQTAARLYDGAGTLLRQSSVVYSALSQELTDARNNKITRVFDAIGNLRKVTDPAPGASTTYGYGFSGNSLISTITDSAGNVISTTTNLRGFKTQMSDPDLGVWNFVNNSFGEPESQTDARNKTITFGTFDVMGRPTTRTDPDGEGTTTWTWGYYANENTATEKVVGRLRRVQSTLGYTEEYFYDQLARPKRSRFTLPGEGVHDVDVEYDATTGFMDRVTYPTSTSGYRLKLQYAYQYGVATKVSDFNDASKVFWQLKDVNARGQSTREQLGADAFAGRTQVVTSYDTATGLMSARQSGTQGSDTNRQNLAYLWDANGNLERRTDHNQSGLYESFVYDALDRLDTSSRDGSMNLDMTYSAIGNITRKSDVGATDYLYTGTQSGCSYPAHSQPHAVRRIGSAIYCYDANGNMTNRNGTSIAWNSRNLPTSITAPGGISSQFSYGPSGNRWKQTATYSGGSETTVYIGGLMEKVTSGTTTYYRHYIAAGSSSVMYVRTSAGATETYHITGDHLGSFSSITNSAGALVVSESFDAFGKRRGANWSGAPTTADMQAIANATRHGYTGHEHLDNLGLIHMNGRVQDPALGRFISADPLLAEPGNSQNLNRYSYVYNNPLTFTDPSGFDVCTFGDIDACGPLVSGGSPVDNPYGSPFEDVLARNSGSGGGGGGFFSWPYTFSAGGSEPSTMGFGATGPEVFASSSGEAGSLFYSGTGAAGTSWVDYHVAALLAGAEGDWRGFFSASVSMVGASWREAYSTPGSAILTTMSFVPLVGVEASTARTAGSIRGVNPGGIAAEGRSLNCVNCAVATDATLAGRPASALPSPKVIQISVLETQFGAKFSRMTVTREWIMGYFGSRIGARGIVYGAPKIAGQPGHVWNIVNQDGVVRVLDGQIGQEASFLFDHFQNFRILVTN